MSSHEEPLEHARSESGSEGGWATFEARMRRRRLAVCIGQATRALELEQLDDANAALTEAKTLSPDAPEIAQLESLFAAHSSPTAHSSLTEMPPVTDQPIIHFDPVIHSDPAWPRVLGLVCALIVMFSALCFSLVRFHYLRPEQFFSAAGSIGPGADSVTEERSPAPPSKVGTSSSAVEVPAEAGTSGGDRSPVAPATTIQDTPAPRPAATSKASGDRLAGERLAGERLPGNNLPRAKTPARPPASSSSALSLRPHAAEPQRIQPIEPMAAPPEPVTTASTAAGGVAPPAATEESAIVSIPTSTLERSVESRHAESERIRSVLVRYENAYNRLDAKAATSVWPDVDRAALGRAFGGLLTQKVSLGLCEITVIGNIGGASCTGKAKWEPKIGGGLHTADRHWSFSLRKTDGEWQIKELKVR
jgi:hypothetical protein